MDEKTKMIAVPESIHARIKTLRLSDKETMYSVISRLLDNMAQKPKESVKDHTQ
jgi:hypothetical protein